jgi:ubiquinone/menaquinone biosynthesis C-methylase UbiE
MNRTQHLAIKLFYSSSVRSLFTNAWYSLISKFDKDAEVTVMNYGYVYPDGTRIFLDSEDESERCALQLYHYVASGISLEGKHVLEVGCGRGGGASYIARHLHPQRIVGVDINVSAIRFAQGHYADQKNLRFFTADAHQLPFEDNSFDAVVNIESALHYKDVRRFLLEVHRVLKPGGYLLIAYFEDAEKGVLPRPALAQSKLRKVREEDITDGIVRAMDLDSSRRQLLAQKLAPSILKRLAIEFAGVRGTDLYDSFASGNCPYFYFIYQK